MKKPTAPTHITITYIGHRGIDHHENLFPVHERVAVVGSVDETINQLKRDGFSFSQPADEHGEYSVWHIPPSAIIEYTYTQPLPKKPRKAA
jgi:hypothetical protein